MMPITCGGDPLAKHITAGGDFQRTTASETYEVYGRKFAFPANVWLECYSSGPKREVLMYLRNTQGAVAKEKRQKQPELATVDFADAHSIQRGAED